MSSFSPELCDLLNKVVPVTFAELNGKRVSLFGSGGFAQRVRKESEISISFIIEHAKNKKTHTFQSEEWCLPQQAQGDIVLATGNGSYQFNQLLALTHADISKIGVVFVIDEYRALRRLNKSDPERTVVLFEHADGVVRHAQHIAGARRYFKQYGKTLVSICPITLGFYKKYHACKGVLMWNGQRPLYDIVQHYMPAIKPTFVEYGFFPQSKYVYFDRKGVNQKCSLMTDSLKWVSDRHLRQLELLKQKFLSHFKRKAAEYILVPLQVPDDTNIVNSCRFTNGMQEFIDYIDNYYPKNVNIVFKAHPKDPHRHEYNYYKRQVSELPFLTLLERAELVHGITSSTLYEALLAGVEVISEGDSLINVHQYQIEKLLAAMVARQVSITSEDLDGKLNHLSRVEQSSNGYSEYFCGDQ